MFCPNISIKKVKDEFNEIVQAFGGTPLTDEEFRDRELRNQRTGSDFTAMEATYRLWDRNEGYAMDSAPNGAHSVLFDDLVNVYGDRATAIRVKSNLYTKEFMSLDVEYDINGEPSIHDKRVQKAVGIKITERKETINRDKGLDKFDFNSIFGKEITKMLSNGDHVSSSNLVSKLLLSEVVPNTEVQLANLLQKHDIPVIVEHMSDSVEVAYTVTDNNGNSVIALNSKLLQKVTASYAAKAILHEIMHALTVKAIEKPTTRDERSLQEANHKLFQSLREMAIQNGWPLDSADNGLYCLTNEKEFAACFATDPIVRELCKNMVRLSNKKIKTRFKNFINSITNVIIGRSVFNTTKSQYNNYVKTVNNYLNNVKRLENSSVDVKTALEQYKYRNREALVNESFINFFRCNYKSLQAEKNALVVGDFERSGKYSALNTNVEKIIDALETRIKALNALSEDVIATKNQDLVSTDQMLQMFTKDNISQFSAISAIRTIFAPQLRSDIEALRKRWNNDDDFSGEEYMYHCHENIMVHKSIGKSINKLLSEKSSCQEIVDNHNKIADKDHQITIEDVYNLKSMITDYTATAEEGSVVVEHIKNKVVSKLLNDVRQDVGADDLTESINIILNDGYLLGEELGILERKGLGSNDASVSPLIRTATYKIAEANEKADRETNERMESVLELARACDVVKLYERDDNGRFTGYLVRRLNFGKFYKDYDSFIQKLNEDLNKKYNLSRDLDERTDPDDIDAKNEWLSAKNKWLSEHAERKYVKEYYDIQNIVPQIAREAINSYNLEINSILSNPKYQKNGRCAYELISDKDWRRFVELVHNKKLLKSFYDINGNKKEKGTVAYEIAEAFQKQKEAFDDYYKKHGGRTPAQKLESQWREARNKVIEECGGQEEYKKWKEGEENNFDKKTFLKWEDRNTIHRMRRVDENDPDSEYLIWKIIREKVAGLKPNYGPEYDRITEEINDKLRPFRDSSGEVDLESISEYLRADLLQLFRERSRIKEKAKKNKAVAEAAKRYQEVVNQYISFEDNKYLRQKKSQASATASKIIEEEGLDDLEFFNIYFHLLSNYGKVLIDPTDGNSVGLRAYSFATKMVAKDDKYMVYEPSEAWQEEYSNDAFLNDKFTDEYDTSIVPKQELYENKEYDKLMQQEDYKKFYDSVLQLMKDANAKQTNRQFTDSWLLPQIHSSLLDRMTHNSPLHALYGAKEWLNEKLGIGNESDSSSELFGIGNVDMTNSDSGVDQVFAKHENSLRGKYPDGRMFNILPQFYTKKMEDPSLISTDLINILFKYYQMSARYEQKRKIRGDLDALLDVVESKQYKDGKKLISGDKSGVYDQLQKTLQSKLYGVQLADTEWRIFGKTINLSKLATSSKVATTAINLGYSPIVALTGMLSSSFVHTVNAITGSVPNVYKHYNIGAATKAFFECMLRLMQRTARFFSPAYRNGSKDKVELLMESYGISGQMQKKYENTNRNRLYRAISRNSAYGFLSACDFFIKSQIMVSELMSHRYVDGEFITKADIYYNRTVWGEDVFKEKLRKYKEGRSAYSVIYVKNGKLEIEDEYKQAYEKSRSLMRNRAEETAEQADGMSTETQRANLQSTILGSFILMHRQYLPLSLQEGWGKTVYDYETQSYKNGQFRNMFNLAIELAQNNAFAGMTSGALLGGAFGGHIGAGIGALVGLLIRCVYAYRTRHGSSTKKSIKSIFNDRFNNHSDRGKHHMSLYNRECFAKTLIEIALLNFVIDPLFTAICRLFDDDDDTIIQFMLLALRRSQWEMGTKYRTSDLTNNIKSPSGMTSLTDKAMDLGQQIGMMSLFTISPRNEIMNQILNGILNKDSQDLYYYDDIVRSGTYEGWNKVSKAAFKLTPFHNIYEQYEDPFTKRKYFENQIMRLPENKR